LVRHAEQPEDDDVFTIAPESWATRSGRKARVPLTTPWKLTSHSHSSSSTTVSSTLDDTATPALLNTAPRGCGRPVPDFFGEGVLRLCIAHVERLGQRRTADARLGLLQSAFVDVGNRDRATVGR
jgi:hypothetical protein